MNRRKESRNDRFPLLDIPELSICLKSCNLNAPEEDLLRPTPVFVQSLYLQILEVFLFIPQSTFANQLNGFNNNNVGIRGNGDGELEEYEEDENTYEALNLVKLNQHLYRFFVDCGVFDFVLIDLIKPDSNRVKRLLSAVVNYARFREEHLYDNEEILKVNNLKFEKFGNMQREFEKVKQLNLNLEERLKEYESKYKDLTELNSYNSKIEKELKNLKKIQESLTVEHLNYKNEKVRLIKNLEDHNYLLLESKKNLDKWKNYLIESPEILGKILNDLNSSLKVDEGLLNQLELKSRNLSISLNSIQIIESDLKNFLNLISLIKFELNNDKNSNLKLNKLKENLNEINFQVNEFNRKIILLQRQIKNINEKYERILNTKTLKKEEFDKTIFELNEIYENLMIEKSKNDEIIYEKKQYISNIDNEIINLKKMFEIEYNETNTEIDKLNSHLNLYLSQINKKLELV